MSSRGLKNESVKTEIRTESDCELCVLLMSTEYVHVMITLSETSCGAGLCQNVQITFTIIYNQWRH